MFEVKVMFSCSMLYFNSQFENNDQFLHSSSKHVSSELINPKLLDSDDATFNHNIVDVLI